MKSDESPKRENARGGKKGKGAQISLDASKNRRGLAETMCASAKEAFEEGDFDDAFETYQRALKLEPGSVDARLGVGRIWLEF
ncbi:MAG: hypothetical protein II561_03185, partial [Thermoguttaceae bacterium]|nr:hypothetical protein [Thermoguttaceae bacterium]